jgi:hypothetical protein
MSATALEESGATIYGRNNVVTSMSAIAEKGINAIQMLGRGYINKDERNEREYNQTSKTQAGWCMPVQGAAKR